jgi:hypothetical protein
MNKQCKLSSVHRLHHYSLFLLSACSCVRTTTETVQCCNARWCNDTLLHDYICHGAVRGHPAEIRAFWEATVPFCKFSQLTPI